MLVVVLLLMLVGFGMITVASVTGTVAWGWVSVAASVAATGFLISSWRGRSASLRDDRSATERRMADESPRLVTDQPVADRPVAQQPALDRRPTGPAQGSERADPAVAAVVAILDRQVFVVDEQPNYHLSGCPVLSGRRSVGVPVREAVELDFTPCAVCTPVRVLAGAASQPQRSSGYRT